MRYTWGRWPTRPERALARWARQVATDANAIGRRTSRMRDRGYDDAQILAITCYVAVRITVNDALGAGPTTSCPRRCRKPCSTLWRMAARAPRHPPS